jgi:hypothetical protein
VYIPPDVPRDNILPPRYIIFILFKKPGSTASIIQAKRLSQIIVFARRARRHFPFYVKITLNG